ncbi:MAG: HAD-IC family P-type ATPase [Pseudomonadota bacterium]
MESSQHPAWAIKADQVVAKLATDPVRGLSTKEHSGRLETYGENKLEVRKTTWYEVLWQQLTDPLVLALLFVAMGLSLLSLSEHITTALNALIERIPIFSGISHFDVVLMVMLAVVASVSLGFWAEYRAGLQMDALGETMVSQCTVIRDGRPLRVDTTSLVPGDIVMVEEGARVPADLRIYESAGAESSEASLTGESYPVKKADTVLAADTPIGDRSNMLHTGCTITRGKASCVVVKTGMDTEIGTIASDVEEAVGRMTPLQEKMLEFVKILTRAIGLFAVVCFVAAVSGNIIVIDALLLAVTAAVATIPSMLPAVQTMLLAFSATVMRGFRAYVRKLSAIEALGSCSIINSDKTGTLTRDEQCVKEIYAGRDYFKVTGSGYLLDGVIEHNGTPLGSLPLALKRLLGVARHCGDARIDGTRLYGDPLEQAMLVLALKGNVTEEAVQERERIPFDSAAKYMAVIVEYPDGKQRLLVKGAPEVVADMCSHELDGNGVLVEFGRSSALAAADDMASKALRTITCAYRDLPDNTFDLAHDNLHDLVYSGTVGMIDPPRESAQQAIARLTEAHIRTVMITGDHPSTALAIARELNIDTKGGVVTGLQWAEMNDATRRKTIQTCSVFARVSAHEKLEIVQTQQNAGLIVAMTGDGVNDAPALATANIGIAMGSGTQVAQGAAAMVLTDDQFATFVPAVEEGRHMYSVLRRVILYTMATNVGQGLLVLFAALGANFLPLFQHGPVLTVKMILLINLIDLFLFTMPYVAEKKIPGIMQESPRDPRARIADATFLARTPLIGLVIALSGVIVYLVMGAAAIENGQLVEGGEAIIAQAQTAAFWAVLFAHIGYVLPARRILTPSWRFNLLSNWVLDLGIVASILLRLVIAIVPALGAFFGTVDIPSEWWPMLIACALPTFFAIEVDKAVWRWHMQRSGIAVAA